MAEKFIDILMTINNTEIRQALEAMFAIIGVTKNDTTATTKSIVADVTGDLTGDVTGDLTGDVTGDVTGDLTGDVTGDVTGALTGDVTGDVTGNVTGESNYHVGQIAGLTMSNDTDTEHDIAVAPGICRDAADTVNIKLSATITKQIDATWAAGDDAGGINDGESVGNATWYHVFVIADPTGATVDVGFDTDIDATNLLADAAVVVAGLTKYRRIGSVLTDGSANILNFKQFGDEFIWNAPVQDTDTANPGAAAVAETLSVPVDVNVIAHIGSKALDSSIDTSTYIWLFSPYQTDAEPGLAGPFTMQTATDVERPEVMTDILTNTSSEIKYRFSASTADHRIWINTHGWKDFRGSNVN